MSISWADVIKIAPALATLDPATQAAILAAVDLLCECDTFEEKCDLAKTYLAAHLGTLAAQAARGLFLPVKSAKVGDVSRGYELPTNWSKSTSTTSFGLLYEFLLARTANAHLPMVC